MEDVPTRICVCIIGASGVLFVAGFFLREVSVFHSFSSHTDTNNVTICVKWLSTNYTFLFFFFLLLFFVQVHTKGVLRSTGSCTVL